MAARYRKTDPLLVDPIVLADPRFWTLWENRYDYPVQSNFPAWPVRPEYVRENQCRVFRRAFSAKAKRLTPALLIERGGRCIACGATEGLRLDHVLPLTWGGNNEPYNLQFLCGLCNSSKGNRLPDVERQVSGV